jgi:GNAT superfamily N-acetyltransferase
MEIRTVDSDADLRRCYPVMAQLRPHLGEDEFIERVRRQMDRYGYSVVYVEGEGQVRAVAGYRISECLCDGRFLYVDDLVTDQSFRSRGYGERLLAWLVAKGKAEKCAELELESGVQRHDAHRFYLRARMRISSYHFSLKLA